MANNPTLASIYAGAPLESGGNFVTRTNQRPTQGVSRAIRTPNPYGDAIFVNFGSLSTRDAAVPRVLYFANRGLIILMIFFAANILFAFAHAPHANSYISIVYGAAAGSLYYVFHKAENIIKERMRHGG